MRSESASAAVRSAHARTHLVKAVHVALTNEAAKVGVLEEARKNLSCEAIGRWDCMTVRERASQLSVCAKGTRRGPLTEERVSVLAPVDQIVGFGVIDHAVVQRTNEDAKSAFRARGRSCRHFSAPEHRAGSSQSHATAAGVNYDYGAAPAPSGSAARLRKHTSASTKLKRAVRT